MFGLVCCFIPFSAEAFGYYKSCEVSVRILVFGFGVGPFDMLCLLVKLGYRVVLLFSAS